MMLFRTLKANLETILNDASGGEYTVVGYQQQGVGAKEVLGNKRRVQVFYGGGEFPKDKSGMTGPIYHDIAFVVRLMCSAAASGDVSVLDDPDATPQQRAAVLAAFTPSSAAADSSMDEMIDLVYQVLMDASNQDVGTSGPPYTVSNRWVSSIQKDAPLDMGEYVATSASITFNCQAKEELQGLTPTPAGSGALNVTDVIDGDTAKQGTTI